MFKYKRTLNTMTNIQENVGMNGVYKYSSIEAEKMATHPGELGTHLLSLLDHVRSQHVLGTLGVNISISCV